MSTVRRTSKSWVRLTAMLGTTGAVGAAAVGTLLHEESAPDFVGPLHTPVLLASADPAPVSTRVDLLLPPSPSPRSPAVRPKDMADVVADRSVSNLAAFVTDATLEPRLRYAALRRLEAEAPAEAITSAIAVLEDTTPLVRLNAIALLTRSGEPRSQVALARLDDRSRQLAAALGRSR